LKGIFSGGGGSSGNSGMSTSTRGGSSSSGGGGFGSFFSDFDTRSNSRGLFSENPSSKSNNDHNAYPVTRYGEAASQPSSGSSSSSPSHGNYGWKLS
jgi:hypothetical protein